MSITAAVAFMAFLWFVMGAALLIWVLMNRHYGKCYCNECKHFHKDMCYSGNVTERDTPTKKEYSRDGPYDPAVLNANNDCKKFKRIEYDWGT